MRASGAGGRGRQQAEIGVVARLVDRAFDDPAMSGGLFVLTLTVMAIVSNAMFLQPSAHPRPLFPVRPVVAPRAPAADEAVTPRQRERPAASIAVQVPLPRERGSVLPRDVAIPATQPQPQPVEIVEPAPPHDAAQPAPALDPARQRLIEIQRELARLGLYNGSIDGIVGPRTRAAISRYQATAGMRVTGEPSQRLLEALAAPRPPASSGGVTPETTGATGAAAPVRQVDDIAALQSRSEEILLSERFSRVQAALNKIGYGPLMVDGSPGPETVNAIRRFELDHGLEITGGVGQLLLQRLIAIGAMDAG